MPSRVASGSSLTSACGSGVRNTRSPERCSIDRSSIDHDKPANLSPEAVNQSIEKHLESLFEIGTAWLGWSPAETWAATPAEILVAERGLVAKLKLMNGVAGETKPKFDPREEITPEPAKAGIAELRAIALQGKAA